MNDLPLVSIGIASYNNALYIEELLESIKCQTYPAIELIIVDDCSRDNSVQVITDWAARTSYPLRLVKHIQNQGITRTFSECRQLATGKYISLIGSDDVLSPETMAVTVSRFEEQDETCGAIYTDCRVIDSKGDELCPSFLKFFNPKFAACPPQGNLITPLLTGFYLPALTTTVRKAAIDAVGSYDESLYSEDMDMWLRLSRKFNFVFIPVISGSYRVHDASAIHANKIALNETFFKIYQKAYFKGEEEWAAARYRLSDHVEHYYANQGAEAPKWLWFALRETRKPKVALFWLTARLGIKYTTIRRLFSK